MPEWINDNWMLSLAWIPALGFLSGLVAKYANKERLWKMWKPLVSAFAKAVSIFLKTHLGTEAEKKLENGLLCTIAYIGEQTFVRFREVLLSDNKKKADKK